MGQPLFYLAVLSQTHLHMGGGNVKSAHVHVTIIKESSNFRPSWQMKISIINYYPDNYTIYRQSRGRNEWGSWQIDTRRHYHLIF